MNPKKIMLIQIVFSIIHILLIYNNSNAAKILHSLNKAKLLFSSCYEYITSVVEDTFLNNGVISE